MFHRLPVAIYCIGIGVGLLGVLGSRMPMLADAEESLGLHLFYIMRGPVKPRPEMVVVALDRESANVLNLPTTPHKWPRIFYARLLEKMAAQQAAVVAFDLIFHEPQQTRNDLAFAEAMRQAGNVVLTQTIDRQTMPLADKSGARSVRVNIEKIMSAVPVLADASVGQAPFPLPKVPVKLNQYWCFRPGSGDVPTLPVVVFHLYARDAVHELIRMLKGMDVALPAFISVAPDKEYNPRDMLKMIRPLRALFDKNADLAPRILELLDNNPPGHISPHTESLIRSLVGLYSQGKSRYLNFYGPPRTIKTISFHRFVNPQASNQHGELLPSLKGRVVFVGQTEGDMFKAGDGFYTSFTEKSGVDISGVEIAATAFANLLENISVYPLKPHVSAVFLLGWGILSAFIGLHFSTTVSAAGLLLLNGAYLTIAHAQFTSNGIWYPLVVPIAVQMPAAFIGGLLWKYRKVNIERQNIREAFGHYLPDDVVDRLVSNIKGMSTGGQVFYGICLFTDAQNYTTVSETLDPNNLTQLMNSYYEAIFKPIKANGGLVLQVIGDSVLALWTASEPRDELKKAACRAAIEITTAVERFNVQAAPNELPTRIGIHAGEILLGNIGAMDHFEYRPVGDIVNTASRLEGLNKYLGTHMLTSREAFFPNNDYMARSVGRFVFKGKTNPVQVHELLPEDKLSAELQATACRLFAAGLDAFWRREWDEADRCFHQVLQIDETDGPSRFYLGLCREYRQQPPGSDWDGSIRLAQK